MQSQKRIEFADFLSCLAGTASQFLIRKHSAKWTLQFSIQMDLSGIFDYRLKANLYSITFTF